MLVFKMSIINQAGVKLSPLASLSDEQRALKRAVDGFLSVHRRDEHALMVIEGAAGTGKSVFLHALFSDLQTRARHPVDDPLHGFKNLLLVNHPEMLKAYKNAAEGQSCLRKKDYERPTTFINRMHKTGGRADIILVDEAHLLLTRADKYNHFIQDNQLDEIVKLARIVVLVFDGKQSLKFKSLWREGDLQQVLARWPHELHVLRHQVRMRADAAVQRWITGFCQRRILPLPVAPRDDAFQVKIFDDAQRMYEDIQAKNASGGLSRMLSTYDYPYRLDGRDYFIEEGAFRLRWDRVKPDERLPWAEREDTIDEVGSVYTVQGFDLNYVGLILGPTVTWDDERQEIVLKPAKYQDGAAFQGQAGFNRQEVDRVKEQIMLNALNVLMTRAIYGLYLYAHDGALRKKLLSLRQHTHLNGEKNDG